MSATPSALWALPCEHDCGHLTCEAARANPKPKRVVFSDEFPDEPTTPEEVTSVDAEVDGAIPEREITDETTLTRCVFCGHAYPVGSPHTCPTEGDRG